MSGIPGAAGRLAALDRTGLLDSLPEEPFDRLTRLAARVLQVPAAVMSLLDRDRQFFKSCVGVAEPWASRRGTPLSHSFCRHVVASAQPLIVEDAREHPQLRDDLAIPDMGVIAYAGMPLVTAEGHVLGSLCVIDVQPRKWSEDEVALLRDLAATVMTEITLRLDILDRQEAEAALRQGEERFRTVVEALGEGVMITDLEEKILYTNRRNCEITGYSAEEMLGQVASRLLLPAPDHERMREMHRTRVEGKGSRYDMRQRRKDGTLRWVEVHGTPLRNTEGLVIGTVGVVTDITQRKQAEEALRESERTLSTLMTNLPGMAYRCGADDDRTLEFVSDGALSLTGYTPAQILGDGTITYRNIIHPDDQQHVLDEVQTALGEKRSFRMEYRVRTALGEEKCVWEQGQGVFTVDGELLFSTGFISDISERRRAEEELERVSLRNTLILESAAEGIYGLDENGLTSFANSAAAAMLGYTMDELVGKPQHQIIHHTRLDGTAYPWEECPAYQTLQDGQVRHIVDEVYWRKDGTSLPVEYTATAQKEGGRIVGAVVTFRNVSERREIERVKDEFLSVVSHELRTPLTSIRGSLGLLASGLSGALPERGQRLLNIAVQNTDRLIRLINDILDIERIESGEVRMETQACEVADLVSQAEDLMRPVADKAAVQLSIGTVDAWIWADPDRIVQVLTNLLSNAIKFSPEGSRISVTASHEDGSVVIAVRDEGRGIPADNLETIFGRFQQVDASDSREKGGTGLGLAISRSVVQQHGGKIWAQSTVGEGSTFYVVLPAMKEEGPLAPNPLAGGAQVLLCDDDPSVRHVVSRLLEREGYRVVVAASGREAVELASTHRPAAVLLDLIMPGMNGWETMSALRAQPATQEIPIVVFSALRPTREQAESRDGADGWVTKPFEKDSLFATLERAVSQSSRSARILLVEDDPDLAQVITTTFQSRGVETYCARSGKEAIELSQRILPDLVILDLVLPEGDGFAVVDWLRRHDVLRNVALVVYSVRDLSDQERAHLKLGHTEFITKGRIAPGEFQERVIRLLDYVVPHSKGNTP